MPYADPDRQREWSREWMRRHRAADPTVSARNKAQMRERYGTDPDHRARLLARMRERRLRVKAADAAKSRARAARLASTVCVRCGMQGHGKLCADCRGVLTPTERRRWR